MTNAGDSPKQGPPVEALGARGMVRAHNPITVFAALGPNPAPLAELIWGLHRRGQVAGDLFLVVDPRGHDYLHRELLGSHLVLDELRQLLNIDLGPEKIHERVVEGPAGTVLDDEDPTHAELYNAATWEVAREATAHAGARPVVFGLAAGRRRTMTAMSTMAFQLLAREHDTCVDVRVDDKRAEGGSGFYFPDQQQQTLVSKAGVPFVAREVGVHLVDVHLPRLRSLLPDEAFATYSSALTAGQKAVDAAVPPKLVVDLPHEVVLIDGLPLKLSAAELHLVRHAGACSTSRRWMGCRQ